MLPVGQQVADQKQHGDERADGDAENGAGGAGIQAHADLQHVPGQGQADAQLAQGLQHLADGGGRHVALALGIAPHTGQQAHAEYRRGQRLNGQAGHVVVHEARQLGRAEEHQQGPCQAQTEKQPDGGVEDLALFVVPALGVGLAGHFGDGQGQAGGRDGQQHVINVVGRLEIRFSLRTQDVVQRELIKGSDDFDKDHGESQNGGAA